MLSRSRTCRRWGMMCEWDFSFETRNRTFTEAVGLTELRTKPPDASAANFAAARPPSCEASRGTAARFPESCHSTRPNCPKSKPVVRCVSIGCLSCGTKRTLVACWSENELRDHTCTRATSLKVFRFLKHRENCCLTKAQKVAA